MLSTMVAWVVTAQRALQDQLIASMRGMGTETEATLAAAGFAVALGVVHALTPGHGKSVVFSYFLGHQARPLNGLMMALKIAAIHSATAALLVLAFGTATSSFGRPAGPASMLQTISYAVIVAIGAFYLWRATTSGGPSSLVHAPRFMGSTALPLAIGLLPCPLTMLIVAFAVGNGLIGRALVLAALVAVGSAFTIGAAGAIGLLIRSSLFAHLDPEGHGYRRALTGLEFASSAAIMLIGVVLLVGSLASGR